MSSSTSTSTFTSVADVNGTWRQLLPATPGNSQTAYNFTFTSTNSTSERAELTDVLFGDVYLCGGQSNMEYGMPAVTNMTIEKQDANNYPHIRFFSVGHATQSSTPLRDLQTVWEPWQVASNTSICKDFSAHAHLFSTFSAVCWLAGKRLSDALTQMSSASNESNVVVPIGLISNNWGGTKVEVWTPAKTYETCNGTAPPPFPNGGPMWNSMILPYAQGPMSLSGIWWYQGEADTATSATAELYSCTFPSMISEWRRAFASPNLYFGFVQLSTWCALPPNSLPEMRRAQMSALALPNVAYATNADHGLGCTIHPAAKQYVGVRIANSALNLNYGQNISWKSPTYASAKQEEEAATTGEVRVRVKLRDIGARGLHLVYPNNYEGEVMWVAPPTFVNCSATTPYDMSKQCAWASINVQGVGWVNASVEVHPNEPPFTEMDLVASGVSGTVLSTSYGYRGTRQLIN